MIATRGPDVKTASSARAWVTPEKSDESKAVQEAVHLSSGVVLKNAVNGAAQQRVSRPSIHRQRSVRLKANTRLLGRLLLATLWIGSFFWNVTSPLKNWYLSRYEIAGAEVAINTALQWTDELDHKYVTFLYDHAGVPCFVREGESMRVVNVYIDLMVLPRSTKWAHGMTKWHQDALTGRYCQSGLVAKRETQATALALATNTSFQLWGRAVHHYVPDQQDCHVNEVAEAILCLKGYNGTQLMNLEWSIGLDPLDPTVLQALTAWQQLVLPDLNDCLARRTVLLEQNAGDLDYTLLNLASEMAANYSLNPHGYAGKRNLVAVYNQREGFIDVNGFLGGVRKVSISGSITERNRDNYDGDLNAVTAVREALWVCGLAASPLGGSLEDCLVREGLRLPSLFIGDKLFRSQAELAARFVDDITVIKGKQEPAKLMQEWNYAPIQDPLPVTYLKTGNMSSVETSYLDIDFKMLFALADMDVPATTVPYIVAYKCIYEPGCADACHNNTDSQAAMFFIYVVRKSGSCYRRRFDAQLINRNGFVTSDCYGIGTGTSTLFFKLDQKAATKHGWLNAPSFVEIQKVADPNAILACIMGGRVPVADDNPFPSGFHNMVLRDTGMVLSVTFGDGSERVLSNMYALVSLAGSAIYAFFVLKEGYRLSMLPRRAFALTGSDHIAQQVAYSVAESALSFRVWRLHFTLLSLFGFFTIFSWSLGAAKTSCTWYSSGTPVGEIKGGEIDLSLVPEYICTAGDCVGHLASSMELVRLLSVSSVMCFFLLGKRHMVGVSVTARGLATAVAVMGVVPSTLTPMVISGLNQWRLTIPSLALIHNQLFIAILWGLFLFLWHRSVPYYVAAADYLLRVIGLRWQLIKHGAYRHISFGGYYCDTAMYQQDPTEWVPLSALLECLPSHRLRAIHFATRCFHLVDSIHGATDTIPQKPHSKIDQAEVPAWVLEADEFYIKLDKRS